ncbi:MAG: hypothetical protein EXR49_09350 [Dehalococcoidia bacterium]|nr:hypothetical protein [Dehalococcoidia bacterium]
MASTGAGKKKTPDEFCCGDVEAMASEFVDQGLDEPLVVKMHRHLGFCPPCQSFVASFSKTVRLLHAMPRKPAPDGLRQSIMKRTKKRS